MSILFAVITILAIIVTAYVFYIIYNDFKFIKGFYALFVIALFTSSIIVGKGLFFILWFLPEEWRSRIGYGGGFALALLLLNFIAKMNKKDK